MAKTKKHITFIFDTEDTVFEYDTDTLDLSVWYKEGNSRNLKAMIHLNKTDVEEFKNWITSIVEES